MISEDLNKYIQEVGRLQQDPNFQVIHFWHYLLWGIGAFIIFMSLLFALVIWDEREEEVKGEILGLWIAVIIGIGVILLGSINYHSDFIEHNAVIKKIEFLNNIINKYKEQGNVGLPQ